MDIGKLPADELKKLLAKAKADPTVLIGPAYGEDAAAVRFGSEMLIAAADPITFAADRIGYYAVCVNVNDIAVMGGVPRWFLATILLPGGSTEQSAESIFDQIEQTCEQFGIALIGGHTEITPAVTQPIVSGCILGEAGNFGLIRSGGARVGDAIILVGGIAIEGASILAREAAAALIEKGVPPEIIARAAAYLDNPGICVLDYARMAVETGGVTAMHDPTEGGLATALRELAAASGTGVEIRDGAIPVLHECEVICNALGLDPLGLIASGSLLVVAEPVAAERILQAYSGSDIGAANIGTVRECELGMRYSSGTKLPDFTRDEIARYFEHGGRGK